ncbi:substrate-binding periplasmic protein [Pseudomonas sp. 5P_3.1_Bac2]|uniref:substrate-binding periplasmic protein n=1 Tax=Pseudomonas sp. 5P_3.1_Bac2 TaxID=2971617 RepID=UPI0021C5708E|nr:transporter substrate-binding domain-containing protein [Pseudomonas sp. 5P_3.1_Bac2]MCU1718618.1 transporter substrate-binding domain-containing protein [Pseudomonas sp. 5P_3.1_Bac2]
MLPLLMLSLLLGAPAQAESVRLVTGNDYAPFTGKTLPAYGMLSKLVRTAFERSGLSSTLYWRPWNRGYLNTLRTDFDATFPYIRSPERERDFLFSEPLYVGEQYIFSRAGELFSAQDISAMQGKRLCYPLGWQAPADVQALVDEGQVQRHSPASLNECARLLLLGRDDFFLADRYLGESALMLSGATSSHFVRSTTPINRSTMHLIVSRKHPKAQWLIDQFNKGLASMQASGDYRLLIDNYLATKSLAD